MGTPTALKRNMNLVAFLYVPSKPLETPLNMAVFIPGIENTLKSAKIESRKL
jgi:hypothetical protein